MKNVLLGLLLTAMLTGASSLIGAEIIPVWNTTVEGKVQDMDFLKGQNEILMLLRGTTEDLIQRRKPENGELISSKVESLSDFAKLALTPDSLRFVQINGIDAALRNLDENFTKINTFSLQNIQEGSIIIYLTSIAVDPIRPIAYVTTSGIDKNSPTKPDRTKVIAYNYETGEHIKDLTGYGEDEYTSIEVSHDGKYLATLNDHKAYLKVWDLATMELVINEPLFDVNSTDWCRPEDIYFSKLNPNLIYYSGLFTKSVNNDRLSGVFTFNMLDHNKKRFIKDGFYSGNNMILFNNETRVFNTSSLRIAVINLNEEILEWYGFPPDKVFSSIVRYNTKSKYFIGASNNDISKFLYDSKSSFENQIEDEIIISPNPTNGIVNINLECPETILNYQISDITGAAVAQSTLANQSGNLQLDFSAYTTGVYFLTINCKEPKTYKIIKE